MTLPSIFIPETIITIVLALIVCFFGYKLKKLALFLIWFIIGYSIGKMIPTDQLISDGQIWATILPLATGLLAALLSLSIERLCVSLLAGTIGFFATMNLFFGGVYTLMPNIVVSVAVGVVLGCIAVACIKPMSILVTAIGGAYYAAMALASLSFIAKINLPMALILTCILATLGAVFQFKNNKGKA
jgi:hypothetical protein